MPERSTYAVSVRRGSLRYGNGPLAQLVAEFDAACALAVRCGLSGNQAILSASRAVAKTSGQDPIRLLGITGLRAEHVHISPRELGQHLGLTAREVNNRLSEAGMQRRIGGAWVPTPAGREHAVILDVGKSHGDGSPVTQVRWTVGVLAALDPGDMFAGRTLQRVTTFPALPEDRLARRRDPSR